MEGVIAKIMDKASSVTRFFWYGLRYSLLYLKSYLKSCKNLLGKALILEVFA
jgi:hypothetical protein